MKAKSETICLPRILSVRLNDFDLYKYSPDVELEFDRAVYCLVGANGIGKTSFLNALVFGLTGGILQTGEKFQDADKYHKFISQTDKINDFFGGRISVNARESASVEIELEWPSSSVIITRPIIDGPEPTQVRVKEKDGVWVEYGLENGSLNSMFTDLVTKKTGLANFSQFVFLMHFVCTFDEERHLLLWDDKALTNALYLAFGGQPDVAEKARALTAAIERNGSLGRNAKYAEKQAKDEIKKFQEALSAVEEDPDEEEEDTPEEKRSEYEQLVKKVDVSRDKKKRKLLEFEGISLQLSRKASDLSEREFDYQKAFSKVFGATSDAHYHPAIRSTISEDSCAVCATNGVAKKISEALDEHECPLCNSPISSTPKKKDREELQKLDKLVSLLQDEVSDLAKTSQRIRAEMISSEDALIAAESHLEEFLGKNDFDFSPNENDGNASDRLNERIVKFAKERDAHLTRAKKYYKKRDEQREELREIEKQLAGSYKDSSIDFVHRFRNLAFSFLGIPVDVRLHRNTGVSKLGFELILELQDSQRLSQYSVSESQGFFLDIALRMALVETISATPATLLIDTPEGSLDIAYESRAGEMFANFVEESSNYIFMTANLRSSQLVLELAKRQKNKGMKVEDMTQWTELSTVQQDSQNLFEQSYFDIEAALK